MKKGLLFKLTVILLAGIVVTSVASASPITFVSDMVFTSENDNDGGKYPELSNVGIASLTVKCPVEGTTLNFNYPNKIAGPEPIVRNGIVPRVYVFSASPDALLSKDYISKVGNTGLIISNNNTSANTPSGILFYMKCNLNIVFDPSHAPMDSPIKNIDLFVASDIYGGKVNTWLGIPPDETIGGSSGSKDPNKLYFKKVTGNPRSKNDTDAVVLKHNICAPYVDIYGNSRYFTIYQTNTSLSGFRYRAAAFDPQHVGTVNLYGCQY